MGPDIANTYPVLLAVVGTVGLLLMIIRAATSLSRAPELPVVIQGDSLRIDGDHYGGPVPLMKLKLEEARAVDLRADASLRPKSAFPQNSPARTNLPSRQSGWFTLENGENALVYITPRTNVAYLPTTADYVVMVSVDDPAQFIASLRRHWSDNHPAPGLGRA